MTFNNSAIIIVIVVAFAFYLIYSQNNQPKYIQPSQQISNFKSNIESPPCASCSKNQDYKNHDQHRNQENSRNYDNYSDKPNPRLNHQYLPQQVVQYPPQTTNIMIENETDPYSDPIKKQDLYSINDPLTYPQLRLPREVLDKYNEYYEKNGSYPPFGQSTKPLFDNPILNGILIKQVDENEPFVDDVPGSVPLFRVKSSKNTNRFFYYILDQRYLSKVELKIPLDNIKINGVRYNNADFYGIPELYDGDMIESIPIYPSSKFRIQLYKTYHFP
ncbi:hypothetical protein [Acanthamoeba polyphaga mimivirus]|uniref:Uncharacterized protein n=6 Tax=Megamimivirinae TaxID=3044648 RepID=A0A2L2DJI3_MIMIV|nr:hypothetical protein MegaChil _gp0572 [Megavirus chiliensis]AEX61744.1 hypothetical protein c7_R681 [Megavirus courdo7]AFX92640.1 hypothetical protein CE11_00614 [Megavirus courdo11]AGD92501.1 hypothetical protein LBA_00583 [Megavirus lba]AUV58517.1 hypothetical protein [Bandra megavirus]AVG46300.1 hypothetical protein [Acanthamoeba polyphaga mimivirus]AVL93895.1 hypothetical protein mvi_535 [Megavirus vitis]